MTKPLALVSGGTRGIGLALSGRLLALGHHVVAFYRSGHDQAATAQAELGAGFTAMPCDITQPSQVAACVTEVVQRYGALRVLVNNAGVNRDRPFLELDHDSWREVIDVNLTGAFLLCRSAVPHMSAAEDPVIVNVGATTGIRPRRNGANYCASKAGLLQLTKCLAMELAPRIRVNCLIPGMTGTQELVTRFHLRDQAALEGVLDEIPLRRLGDVEDIADALQFLVGPGSAYVNGQRLIVDGGQFMW